MLITIQRDVHGAIKYRPQKGNSREPKLLQLR